MRRQRRSSASSRATRAGGRDSVPGSADESAAEYRPLLFSIARGMPGSVGDAEDLVQDAFLGMTRARQAGTTIADPKAYLTTAVTRLGINYLKSARVRRETYVGDWLPEPIVVPADGPGPAEHAELADSLSMAFLVMLEELSPVERAVFMLREVFGYRYPAVARITGKTEVNCRQIFARARQRISAGAQTHTEPPVGGSGVPRARNSPAGSSRPPGAATWRRCSTCSRRTWCSTGTAAARRRRSRGRWPDGSASCG